MTPGVDGGHRKAYDGTVFRSESESRKDVRARARLSGEQRRVGCVREYAASSFAYYTLGWKFTVRSASLVVSKLGVFDYSADGLVDNHEVAIWEEGNTTPLTRVTVTTNSPTEGPSINSRGKFRYEVTSGLILRSNVTYRIGAYYDKLTGSADQNARGPANVTSVTQSTDNAIIYTGNCFIGDANNYQPLTYPSTYSTTRYTGYFGPNFRFSMALPGTLISVQ